MSRPVAAARPYKETIDSKSPDVRRTRVNEAISRGRERRAAAAAAAEEEEGPSGLSALLCCCLPGGTGNALLSEVAMTASAMRGPPPLELLPGYANESGSGRDPPTSGWLEVVNKSERDGEVIAVLAGATVVELLRCKASPPAAAPRLFGRQHSLHTRLPAKRWGRCCCLTRRSATA